MIKSSITPNPYEPRTTFTITCVVCGRPKTMTLCSLDLIRWQGGELIQDVFPGLTPDERELMVSAICGDCFDSMFAEAKEIEQV